MLPSGQVVIPAPGHSPALGAVLPSWHCTPVGLGDGLGEGLGDGLAFEVGGRLWVGWLVVRGALGGGATAVVDGFVVVVVGGVVVGLGGGGATDAAVVAVDVPAGFTFWSPLPEVSVTTIATTATSASAAAAPKITPGFLNQGCFCGGGGGGEPTRSVG